MWSQLRASGINGCRQQGGLLRIAAGRGTCRPNEPWKRQMFWGFPHAVYSAADLSVRGLPFTQTVQAQPMPSGLFVSVFSRCPSHLSHCSDINRSGFNWSSHWQLDVPRQSTAGGSSNAISDYCGGQAWGEAKPKGPTGGRHKRDIRSGREVYIHWVRLIGR